MSVKIAGNTTGTDVEVDTTAKAMRVTLYDARGNNRGIRATYRASTAVVFAAAASAQPFLLLYGSSTKTIRVQRITATGMSLTAVAYLDLTLRKYSTVQTGGTPVALTQTNMDSTDGAATASLCSVYTAAPTAGTLVGTLAARRTLAQATVAVAAGMMGENVEFDFRGSGENDAPTLRGTTQGIGLGFSAAPATAVTLSVDVEWTEE